jgi:hypothetical protein
MQEAAMMMGKSYQTVRRMALERGELEYKRDGLRVFVKRSQVQQHVSHELAGEGDDRSRLEAGAAVELRYVMEQNETLKQRIGDLEGRIRDLEEDKGFLLDQVRQKDVQIEEKDSLIGRLTPLALPKPKATLRERVVGLFRRQPPDEQP